MQLQKGQVSIAQIFICAVNSDDDECDNAILARIYLYNFIQIL